ncbi:MAG: exo-alpha-sialidase [Opitutae bacterium]|nr:exo-alpha-sialidase [Opitutae bacterium]
MKSSPALFCLLIAWSALWSTPAAAAPEFSETQVWDKRENNYVSHFVFGIGVTANDTILIACEGRVGGADAGEKDLLVKRSTDHGATWSADAIVEGRSDDNSWSNPTFVTDGATTYLFYSWSVSSDIGRVFYRTSTDHGATWSERTEITHLWNDNPHGWTQHATIGHGIVKQHEPGKGRVLVAFHHRGKVAQPAAKRGYGNDVIVLGPNGWQISGGPSPEATRGTNEARLAERADGTLYLLARQATGDNQLRARSESTDGGKTWSAWITQADIRGTVCDSGLLRFNDDCHLYSFPSGTEKSAQRRRDMTIKASLDGGKTWPHERMLYRGQATYSDLARDSAGNVYCIYGRDGSDFMGERVFVARFNVEWVTGATALKPTESSRKE